MIKTLIIMLSVPIAVSLMLRWLTISDAITKHNQEMDVLIEMLNNCKHENDLLKVHIDNLQHRDITPKGIYQPHLKNMIDATLHHLGVPNSKEFQRLILLTIVAESNMGCWNRQLKGPAVGIVQIEPETEKTVLNWLRKNKPKVYQKIKELRIPAKLSIHEAEYNNSYSIALCYAVYLMRNVKPKGDAKALATLYKKYYNTPKGKATVQGVLGKLENYGVNL